MAIQEFGSNPTVVSTVSSIREKIYIAETNCCGSAAVLREDFRKISGEIDTLKASGGAPEGEIRILLEFFSGLRDIIGH